VDSRGVGPKAKRRRGLIAWGLLAANAAAAGQIGLGFWLNHVNGAAGILISSDFLLVPLVMGLITAFFWKPLTLTTTEYFLYSLPPLRRHPVQLGSARGRVPAWSWATGHSLLPNSPG
jgi:hypothetical protein